YTYERKNGAPLSLAPPGAIGLELALPALWQQFVASEQWSALQLWQCLSQQPALCLAQEPPTLVIERPLEAVLFDPQRLWPVEANTLKSRSSNTPWLGKTLTGQVLQTWSGLNWVCASKARHP
ncbi:MAG: dihydroorotase, partial [Leptolyngbyaceae cyanobacterium SM1_1_3]|nr:dihydroorotase [Leptolyngbyaceae cyanobacterium SM1_1_3]